MADSFFKDVLNEITIFSLLRKPVVSDFGNILSRLRVPTSDFHARQCEILGGWRVAICFSGLGSAPGRLFGSVADAFGGLFACSWGYRSTLGYGTVFLQMSLAFCLLLHF